MLQVPVCSAELECPLSACHIACLFPTVCLCASVFQKTLFAGCTNLTRVDIRKGIEAAGENELVQTRAPAASPGPGVSGSKWLGSAAFWGFPLALMFSVAFNLGAFLIGIGKKKKKQACMTWHYPSRRAGVSPFFLALNRGFHRSRLSPLLVLSQTPFHLFFQSKGTHTHDASGNGDERLGPRKQKWTFLWQKPDLGSHFFPPFASRFLILRDSDLSLGSGSCPMKWQTSKSSWRLWVAHLCSAPKRNLSSLGKLLQFQWEPHGFPEF